jgi:hypothetical protein
MDNSEISWTISKICAHFTFKKLNSIYLIKYLNSYLTEFMWRKNFTSVRYEATEAIIDAIAESHSL